MKHIATDWKPKRYARKDRNGKTVNMDQRAEATKEYLAKDQWGIQAKQTTEKEIEQREKMAKKVTKVLNKDRDKYKNVTWNTDPPTLEDIKDFIKQNKRGKAPGPDGITTDFLKDLSDEALEEIRKLVRNWWVKREVPKAITLARVVSL